MKNLVKTFLSALLLVVCLSCVAGCNNMSNSDYSDIIAENSITRSQAISYAKSSSTVQNEIASLYELYTRLGNNYGNRKVKWVLGSCN